MPKQEMIFLIRAVMTLLVAFFSSYFINLYLINLEKKRHLAQAIRDDIVATHQLKHGTPTMGGLGIVIGTLVATLAVNFSSLKNKTTIGFIILLIIFSVIGLADDLIKVRKKNAKGLSAVWRILMETLGAMLVLYLLGFDETIKWQINLPFPWRPVYLGALFIPLVIIMLVGSSNAVNMADGLDGLASGLVFMAITPFIIIAINQHKYDVALFLLATDGAISGFLPHNFHPAKIFMGDVGSLPLGVIIAYAALLLNAELLLLIAGGLFIVETLSVIMQVTSFKVSGKRIFKMAPFHHHLEMGGMAEWKVVMLFYIIGYILSFVALLMGVMQ